MTDDRRQKEKDLKFYIIELNSEECICGRDKVPGNSFCYTCYKSLPGDMQRALYQRMGGGYEAAYDEAVLMLDV